ncbi:hypothetical protein OT109_04345 [Phycisphaeraceae bacterium D3-23]
MLTPRITTAALLAALTLGVVGATAHAQDAAQSRPNPGPAPANNDAPAADPAGDEDDDGLFADPDATDGDNDPPPTVEAQDLAIGETIEVEPDHATFRFQADQPGMLTLLTYLPDNQARVRMQLTDAEGGVVPGGFVNGNAQLGGRGARIVVDEFGNPTGALPGLSYITVPLPEAGDYRIEMTVVGETEASVQVGGSWVAFEQVAGVPVQPAPPVVPPPPPPPPFDPTEVATDLATGEALELEIEDGVGWVKVVAEEPGTLVVVSRAGNNEVSLSAFRDGQFADPRYTMNRNRSGRRGNEALMFHANAGDTWFVRVNTNNATPVPLRAALIPDDLEPVEDE